MEVGGHPKLCWNTEREGDLSVLRRRTYALCVQDLTLVTEGQRTAAEKQVTGALRPCSDKR